MPKLSVEQLVQGIKGGRPLSPFSIDLDLLDKYVDCAIEKKLILSTASIETQQLFLHLKEQLDFISVDKKLALSKCEVFVLPFPICLSYAHELEDGRKIIVIANGLIDLIANAIFSSHIQSMLPPDLDKYYLLKFRKDMPASHLLSNALFLLQLQFYRFCQPLPNLQAFMPPEALQQSRDAINGALLFILLHELGHHELGHLDNEKIRPMRYQKIIDEKYSIDQHQEMDADTFAVDSLVEPAKLIGTYWHQCAINFFMQMELVSGQQSGFEHPSAINRVFHSDTLRSDLGKAHDVLPRHQFFEGIASRYTDTKQHSHENGNALINTSREGCLHILKETNEALKHFNIDISPIWKTPSPRWLDTKFS